MYLSIRILVLLVFITRYSCLGFYIRNPVKANNDEWKAFQNKLGLSNEKVELLKSQKDQEGTKELLSRFIMENPKYSTASIDNKQYKRPRNQFKQLLRAFVDNINMSKSSLKTTFNFELKNTQPKPLKRMRRKISVNMVSDMSSERVERLLQMFYQKYNIERSDYENDRADQHNGDEDFNNSDTPQRASMDKDVESDYAYDNLYDDEGDVDLTAKSRQNLEYGSFQDLILQAKSKQWERESEETKLHSPQNDHFI